MNRIKNCIMNKFIEFIWKVWLRPYQFTAETSNDYIAEVSTAGRTIRNEEIARLILKEGSENQYETILGILNRRDNVVMRHVLEGGTVQDRCMRIAPRIPGIWTGANAKYNPTEHKPTTDMTLTAEFRKALAEVRVELLGVKESGAYIGLVTDAATGKTDGSITPLDDIIINGDKIKIVPEGDDGIGIFLHSHATGTVYPVTHRLTQNEPKKIFARLPAMPAGDYTLKIVTRFSVGAVQLLHEPRTITYDKILRVE